MEPLEILHQDDFWVAIDKPAGVHVHRPEDPRNRITPEQNGLSRLRDQIGRYVYPAHRLDPGAQGIVLYTLTSAAAALAQEQFSRRLARKRYLAWVRGWLLEPQSIERPLKRDHGDQEVEAKTEVLPHWKFEYQLTDEWKAGRPHPTVRLSCIEARPSSGIWHQIRRHCAGISHPLIGDVMHGDGWHNRWSRAALGIHELKLRAVELELEHPLGGRVAIRAPDRGYLQIPSLV